MIARLVLTVILAPLFCESALAMRCDNPRECLTREGRISLVSDTHRRNYERKLFVTPDDVARYLFLTNAPNDGDRSAAIYRASSKTGSLPGDFWLTTTEASDSLIETARGISVKRYDAPVPASTAKTVHRLWLAFLEATREEEHTIICSPTGIFSATTGSGRRVTAGTFRIARESCLCSDLWDLGEALIGYPKLGAVKRVEAARRIERTSHGILQRIWLAKDA